MWLLQVGLPLLVSLPLLAASPLCATPRTLRAPRRCTQPPCRALPQRADPRSLCPSSLLPPQAGALQLDKPIHLLWDRCTARPANDTAAPRPAGPCAVQLPDAYYIGGVDYGDYLVL